MVFIWSIKENSHFIFKPLDTVNVKYHVGYLGYLDLYTYKFLEGLHM